MDKTPSYGQLTHYLNTNKNENIFNLILQNNLLKIKSLVERNKSLIYARNKDDSTPMTFAIKYGFLDMVIYLFNVGVTVNEYYDNNILLLSIAMTSFSVSNASFSHLKECTKYFDIMEVLIEKGSDVNEVDKNGVSLLEILLNTSELFKASWLLRMGADPNKCRKDGYTHLYNAISKEYYSHIKLLLGVKVFKEEYQDFLAQYGEIKIQTDVNKGSENIDINTVLLAASVGNIDMFELLLENGANINHVTESDINNNIGIGANVLHYASYYGKTQMCLHLIKKGFDVNAQVTSGDTPIIIVIRNKNNNNNTSSLLQTLIKKGGDPDKANNLNETPISIAVRMADSVSQMAKNKDALEEVVTILIEYEVDVKKSILTRLGTEKMRTIIENRLKILDDRKFAVFGKSKTTNIESLNEYIKDGFKDYINLETYSNFEDFFDEDEHNKVIKIGDMIYGINAETIFNAYFRDRPKRYEEQFYACKAVLPNWPNRTNIDWKTGALFNLKRIGYNVSYTEPYVSYNLFYRLLTSDIKMFELIENTEQIPATTSLQMIHLNPIANSANHCQERTGGLYYTIKEIRLNTTPKSTPEASKSDDESVAHRSKKTRMGGSTKGKKQTKRGVSRKQKTKRRRPTK